MSGCWVAVGGLREQGVAVASWTDDGAPAWTGHTTSDLVAGLLATAPAGTTSRAALRDDARRTYALAVAERLQADAIETALRDGTWSYEGASPEEVDLLHHMRGWPIAAGSTWTGAFELYVVRPAGRQAWTIPGGKRVQIIDPTGDHMFIASLVEVGVLKAGRLD